MLGKEKNIKVVISQGKTGNLQAVEHREIRGGGKKKGETTLWNKTNLSIKSSSKFGIRAGEEVIHLRQEPAASSTTSTAPQHVGIDLPESIEDALDTPC